MPQLFTPSSAETPAAFPNKSEKEEDKQGKGQKGQSSQWGGSSPCRLREEFRGSVGVRGYNEKVFRPGPCKVTGELGQNLSHGEWSKGQMMRAGGCQKLGHRNSFSRKQRR